MISPTEHGEPRIHVTGEAVVTRRPDIAYINLFIKSEGILLEDAVRESTTKLDQIERALRNAHHDILDIQVHDIHIGEGRTVGFAPDRRNPPRPEVVKGLVLKIPPNPDLA